MPYKAVGRAENFTDPFLVTLGIFLFMSFWVIAAAFGYIWVAISAYSLNKLFFWISRRKGD